MSNVYRSQVYCDCLFAHYIPRSAAQARWRGSPVVPRQGRWLSAENQRQPQRGQRILRKASVDGYFHRRVRPACCCARDRCRDCRLPAGPEYSASPTPPRNHNAACKPRSDVKACLITMLCKSTGVGFGDAVRSCHTGAAAQEHAPACRGFPHAAGAQTQVNMSGSCALF